jgi:DNA-binding SARP family transcriptional activator/TolB-like protein/Tfp pilus assembly protein PilF
VASGVRLDVMGGFVLRVDGQDGPTLPPKTRALLTVLAFEAPRPIGRERLGELLWPSGSAKQVHGSLREALYQLRKALRPHPIVASRDGGLVLDGGVRTDLAAWRGLDEAADPAGLRRAAAAYGGPLLDGIAAPTEDFADWLATARAELQRRVLAVLARLADRLTAGGDAAGALEAAERMFAIDRLDEAVHLRLLEACRAAGRRADGLRHYAAIAELLRRELDTVPGARLRQAMGELRAEMDPPLRPQPPTRGAPPAIAVLPFAQLGDEAVPSHLADGILVDTICQLAGLRELQVISHGSTLGYRDQGLDLRQVGRELGARYVVRGAMRRRGAALRLTTELTDAGTGAVVWARSHDTTATLDFADQDRLVAQIVNTLAPRVQELELKRIRGQRPESLTVYDKVLLAREHLLTLDRDSFDAAKPLLDDAVASEPDYPDVHALLSDWHTLALTQGWLADRDAAVRTVEAEARRALSLDAENCRALMFHAHRRSLLHRDFDAATALYDRALEAWPGSAQTWLWSAYTWAYMGETQDAIRRINRAVELSPRDRNAHDYYSTLCVAHYVGGDYATAAHWGLKAIAEPAHLRAGLRWTAGSLAAAGDLVQARAVAQRAMREIPEQRVRDVVNNSPIRDAARREAYGRHLLLAGIPA